MRIGSASGIAGHGEFSLICPVPDGETLTFFFGANFVEMSGKTQVN